MNKSIRKIGRILLGVVLAVLLLFLLLVATVRLPFVQQFAVQEATEFLGKKLDTEVSIGGLYLDFTPGISADEIFVRDLQGDTLLYARSLDASLDMFTIDPLYLNFDEVNLIDAYFNMYTPKGDSSTNLQFVIDAFAASDTSNSSANFLITADEVNIENARFNFEDNNEIPLDGRLDYAHLRLSKIFLNAEDVRVEPTQNHLNLIQLSAIDQSGFVLNSFAGELAQTRSSIKVKAGELRTANSNINLTGGLFFRSFGSFNNFLSEVNMRLDLVDTKVATMDLTYFLPQFEGLNDSILISGELAGSVSDLSVKTLRVNVFDETELALSGIIIGLPNIKNTVVDAEFENVHTTITDVQKVLNSNMLDEKIELPKQVENLGYVTFKGYAQGVYDLWQLNGNLSTAPGNLLVNGETYTDENGLFAYDAKLATSKINLRQIIGDSNLNEVAFDLVLKGNGRTQKTLKARADGVINYLDYAEYRYDSIQLAGNVTGNSYRGNLSMIDENIVFAANANIDLGAAKPSYQFQADVRHANLVALNLADFDSVSTVTAKVEGNFEGKTLEEIEGEIALDSLEYTGSRGQIRSDSLNLIVSRSDSLDTYTLSSDIITGMAEGSFDITKSGDLAMKILHQTLPRYFPDSIEGQFDGWLKANFQLDNLKQFSKVFALPVVAKGISQIDASIDASKENIQTQINLPVLEFGKTRLVENKLDLMFNQTRFDLDYSADTAAITDSFAFERVAIKGHGETDSLKFDITAFKNSGEPIEVDLHPSIILRGQENMDIQLDSSSILLAGFDWAFNERSQISIDSTAFEFKDFRFSSEGHYFEAIGKISESPDDTLFVNLNQFDLEYANFFTSTIGFNFDGEINGRFYLNDPYQALGFGSELTLDSLEVNRKQLGNGVIDSDWNGAQKKFLVDAYTVLDERRPFEVDGYIQQLASKDDLKLNVALSQFPINILEPVLKDNLQEMEGGLSGNVRVTGQPAEPQLKGKLRLQDAKMRVVYLNSVFEIEDEIVGIEPDMVTMDGFEIIDAVGNSALVTGTILHNNFQFFNLDILAQLKNFKAMDTDEFDNDLFYGTVYTTGDVSIEGTLENLNMVVDVTTDEGTEVSLPLGGPTEVGEYDFIKFESELDADSLDEYEVDLSGITLTLKLNVTDDAKINMVFDPTVGDAISATGNGKINMEITPAGDFSMFGEYEISRGDYLFTLQNLINKRFYIEPGSRIIFNGDPLNAQLDLTARYSLRTSLAGLGGIDTAASTGSVPVNIFLNMFGQLNDPNLGFDVKLPNADASTRAMVSNLMTTEEETNRQVFSLLIVKSFVPPDQGYQAAGLAGNTTTEMLSNQLTNWVNQINQNIDLGVNYSAGNQNTTDEVQLAVSTQLFDDRMIVEGTFGVGGNSKVADEGGNNLQGDFNVEYKLSDDGNFRAKAFNRSNAYDPVARNQARDTQGAGLIYTREFETWRGLWRKIFGKKEDEVQAKSVN